jgi:hypothetical protein
VAPLASPIYYDEAGMNAYICRYCRQPSYPGLPASGWLHRDRNQCLDSGAGRVVMRHACGGPPS